MKSKFDKISDISQNSFGNKNQRLNKTANEINEDAVLPAIGAAALGIVGVSDLPDAKRRLIGTQRIYHGTSREAAESIRRTGLQPSKGAAKSGTTNLFFGGPGKGSGHPVFERARDHAFVSKGRIGKYLSRQQSYMHDPIVKQRMMKHYEALHKNRFAFAARGGVREAPIFENVGARLRGHGELMKADIRYSDFIRDFKKDQDWGGLPGYKTKTPIEGKYFKGYKPKIGRREWLGYLKKHKARAASSLIAPAALTGSAILAGRAIIRSRQSEEE